LCEAQGGRIWVDTEMGTGSTFSVLLPISQLSTRPAEE
jgi:signal transduction histidine kinase